jgi:hypothetical protein
MRSKDTSAIFACPVAVRSTGVVWGQWRCGVSARNIPRQLWDYFVVAEPDARDKYTNLRVDISSRKTVLTIPKSALFVNTRLIVLRRYLAAFCPCAVAVRGLAGIPGVEPMAANPKWGPASCDSPAEITPMTAAASRALAVLPDRVSTCG